MKRREMEEFGDPASVTEAVSARRRKASKTGHGHEALREVVRTATHRGHHIVVRTTYAIEVDGTAIKGHFGVTDDGQVHYHAVPNVSFGSAIDMVKKLIDTFPDDFPPCPECRPGVPCDEHAADHDHAGGH